VSSKKLRSYDLVFGGDTLQLVRWLSSIDTLFLLTRFLIASMFSCGTDCIPFRTKSVACCRVFLGNSCLVFLGNSNLGRLFVRPLVAPSNAFCKLCGEQDGPNCAGKYLAAGRESGFPTLRYDRTEEKAGWPIKMLYMSAGTDPLVHVMSLENREAIYRRGHHPKRLRFHPNRRLCEGWRSTECPVSCCS
jgi:hypothetical protein